jgi:hypothetical protein
MKKLAILLVLALEMALCGCGNSTPNNTPSTSASGNWEAQLSGSQGFDPNLLNFITGFSVGSGGGALDVTSVSFFNSSPCFASSASGNGSATLTTSSSGQVTGTMNLTINSGSGGNSLALTGQVSGTSNGTSNGTLSNGVFWGTWTLTSSDTKCTGGITNPAGTFTMCQGAATCTHP